jgi:hypothetical protein
MAPRCRESLFKRSSCSLAASTLRVATDVNRSKNFSSRGRRRIGDLEVIGGGKILSIRELASLAVP